MFIYQVVDAMNVLLLFSMRITFLQVLLYKLVWKIELCGKRVSGHAGKNLML